MRTLNVLSLLAAISCTAFADSATFDFEATTPGYYAGSLAVSDNGLNLTVTPEGYPSGFVYVGGSGVPLLGSVSVIGSQVNPLASNEFSPLRFSFSQSVTAITFAFGDAGGDDDSPVVITGYDALNNLLGTLTTSYPAGDAAGATLSGSFADASYFILTSGTHTAGSNSDSIFWEVPSVTFASTSSVPEPSSVILLLTTLLAAGFVLRKRIAPHH